MTRYLSLAEYFWLAEQVTGVAAAALARASRSDLADSALHAPQAGFGEEEFYPTSMTKQRSWYAGWHGTIHSATGTSGLPGRHW